MFGEPLTTKQPAAVEMKRTPLEPSDEHVRPCVVLHMGRERSPGVRERYSELLLRERCGAPGRVEVEEEASKGVSTFAHFLSEAVRCLGAAAGAGGAGGAGGGGGAGRSGGGGAEESAGGARPAIFEAALSSLTPCSSRGTESAFPEPSRKS